MAVDDPHAGSLRTISPTKASRPTAPSACRGALIAPQAGPLPAGDSACSRRYPPRPPSHRRRANQPPDRPPVSSRSRPGSDLRCRGAASLGRLNNPTARLSKTMIAAEMSTVARAISAVIPELGSVANTPSSPRQNGIDATTRTGCTLRHARHAASPNIQYGSGASSKSDGAWRQSLQTLRIRYMLSISSSPKKANSTKIIRPDVFAQRDAPDAANLRAS